MSKKKSVSGAKNEVGYGKPPKKTQFKKGQSGNPKGRPKGSKNQGSKSYDERLKDMVLEEAYRTISVQEDGGMASMSMLQAILRSLAVKAAKGDLRAQKLVMDMICTAEAAKIEQEENEQINININFTERAG
jgi:hypothetical protein|tara:strand:+ start:406 stop:801 length:396 start_codon:yes stop_codon:yes gene_type:complete